MKTDLHKSDVESPVTEHEEQLKRRGWFIREMERKLITWGTIELVVLIMLEHALYRSMPTELDNPNDTD